MTDLEDIAEIIKDIFLKSDKSILTSFLGETAVKKGIEILNEKGVPNYSFPEHAIRALRVL